jgi:hypothetical protein
MIWVTFSMAVIILIGIVAIIILAIDNRINKITRFFISNIGIATLIMSIIMISCTYALINTINQLDIDLQNQNSNQLGLTSNIKSSLNNIENSTSSIDHTTIKQIERKNGKKQPSENKE